MDELTRLLSRVQRSEGCWLWTGATNDQGYGQVRGVRDGRSVILYVHRLIYELTVGPIPEGYELDHIKANGCTSTACVKVLADEYGPAHLEPVTHAENMRRAIRTHCANGHPFTPENTRIHALGHRVCITCSRAATRKANAKYRAKQVRATPNYAKTHCPQGHPYETAYGRRICRECRQLANREYMRRRAKERRQGG